MRCHRQNKQSDSRKTGIWILLYIVLLAVSIPNCVQAKSSSLILSVSHGRTGDIFYSIPVKPGAVIRLSWIHSVELTPWEEYYQVTPAGKIILRKTRFQSYGAGMPEYGGIFRKEREWIIHEQINKEIPAISWIHSKSAKFKIDVNGTVFLKPDSLPHHEPLKLTITNETP